MGLMGTLAKVAIGYAAARGVDKMAGGQGLGGLLGGGAQIKGAHPASSAQAQMGDMLSGKAPQGGGTMQGMIDKMTEVGIDMSAFTGATGGANPMAAMMDQLKKGGFDLSSLMGGGNSGGSTDKGPLLSSAAQGGAGLAGILAAAGGAAAMQGKGVAGLLDQFNASESAPDSEKSAGLMLRAMIQAAKADGAIDKAEKAKILETVGEDADPADIAFVKAELAAPVDVKKLAADTPEAQRMQVYSASLMTIRVDTQDEAEYLDSLAQALSLDEPTVNMLHMQMGVQPLYN
ncbi:tellurite resistance TerB family protein [Puniceibacterium sediminis]|uniref:Uncharacterized membrane protein YebE, DUF533 family n=1 Tax=Puniceibacterium sediminis TaxID=1608407 RepID=A0A238W3W3_9RHOB|nr:tellurite resistance TerB family protein [Puniceibacterium sediminis]SNR41206.1 Uncharacterized membrane protein YebE, DUF533 family [Puniceibacterium sediminis]